MSQRWSGDAGGAAAPASAGVCPVRGALKFMSVMLTYFGFNVTKKPSFTKYSDISSPAALWKPETPVLGQLQSEFPRRAIVDRHSTKHTGLNRPRKTKGAPPALGPAD